MDGTVVSGQWSENTESWIPNREWDNSPLDILHYSLTTDHCSIQAIITNPFILLVKTEYPYGHQAVKIAL